jgi:hypothetical protein
VHKKKVEILMVIFTCNLLGFLFANILNDQSQLLVVRV